MAIKTSSIQLPTMTPGSQRSISVLRFGKAGARPKVYMQAAIHANEMPGTMAMHHLMPLLAEADKKGLIQGEIILVPTVNPIGQAQLVGNSHAGRYNLLSYENFNRNWIDLSDAVAINRAQLGPHWAGSELRRMIENQKEFNWNYRECYEFDRNYDECLEF